MRNLFNLFCAFALFVMPGVQICAQDAYEEALDLAVYLKQAMIERGEKLREGKN